MDQHHHHHHQQQQWRPMPIPGNICPTCSISHFPFCPPQPPFNQNPRPPFDPYRGLTGPPHPFTDGFADPRQWRRNPSLDRESYGQFQLQSYSNGFTNEGDRNSKRPRVDDIQNNQNSVRNSSDFERRLRLIRDHGGTLTGPPHEGGPGSMPGMNNLETNRYVQESSGFDGNYDGTGVGEYRKFHDPRFGSSDRIGQHYMQSNRNGFHNEEEFAHSRYGQVESSLHPFQTYGINNVDQPPPLHISQRVPYPGSEVPKDNYHNAHNPQWRQSSDSVPANEPKYSHMNAYPEQRGSAVMDDRGPKNQLPQPYGMQYPVDMRHDFHSSGLPSDVRQPFEVGFHSQDGNQGPIRHQSMPGVTQHGAPNMSERGGYFPSPSGRSMVFENTGQMEASRFYSRQPPIPSSPPPPLPVEPALRSSSELKTHSSPPNTTASLFPVPVSSSAMVSSSYPPIPDAHSLTPPYFHNKPLMHASTDFFSEAARDGQPFSLKQLSSNKPKVIDASHLFKQPHRATRPDHIVIILRGLPGSGKSYLAKMLRDLEVENGGRAPRIHSMDDYFMTEVEKIEECDVSKSSVRGKKPIMKKVMEYCYEPEMEQAYRSSMLKAFKKTLEEGGFTFIIVDDRNLRVADFAQFWAIAKAPRPLSESDLEKVLSTSRKTKVAASEYSGLAPQSPGWSRNLESGDYPVQAAFLFLLVARGSVLLCLIDIPFEHATRYHVWLGHLTMMLFTLHGLFYVIAWTIEGDLLQEILEWKDIGVANLAGVISLLAGLLMWVTSLHPVRKHKFELFFYTHQLFVIFVVFLALHVGDFIFSMAAGGIFLFILDRFLRFCQSRRTVDIISAKCLPCGTVELILSKPRNLRYNALSFVFLQVRGLSWLQWHPFSVSSSPLDGKYHLSILIKVLGEWTEKLRGNILNSSEAELHLQPQKKITASVEGPYGHELPYHLMYENLILVAGGIGISPFLAILSDILHRIRDRKPCLPRNLLIVWAVKRSNEIPLLFDINMESICPFFSDKLNLDIRIYVTRESQPPLEEGNVHEAIMNSSHSPVSVSDRCSMSVLVGTGNNIWSGLYVISSTLGFVILIYLLDIFYINPFGISSWWYKGLLFIICMLASVFIFGGLVIGLWHLWERRIAAREACEDDKMTVEKIQHNETVAHKDSCQQYLANSTSTYYGSRPELDEIFGDISEKWGSVDVGVIVCGPPTLQSSVAKEIRSQNIRRQRHHPIFHFNSHSFDL